MAYQLSYQQVSSDFQPKNNNNKWVQTTRLDQPHPTSPLLNLSLSIHSFQLLSHWKQHFLSCIAFISPHHHIITLAHLDRLNWGSYEQPNFLFIFLSQFYVIHVSGSCLLMLVLMYCNFQVMKLKWFPLVLCKSLTWCLHVSTRCWAVFVYAWKL